MRRGKTYYWAHGEKIPLDDAPQLAVDLPAATRASLWDGELAKAAGDTGTQVTRELVLVPADTLSRKLRDQLEEAGAVQPVFRSDDTLLVVLPEVRVETHDPATAAAVQSVADDWPADVEVEQPRPGRLVLRPASGRGKDALDLANRVAEEVRRATAQARFLHVVPDPDPPSARRDR